MKKLLPMLLFFLVPAVSFGQGSAVNDVAFKNLITGIAPAAGATVTVCTSAGTGIPCSPQATVYSDIALTQPITPPILADSNGYYSFFAASGTYIVTVTGAGTSGRSVTYTLPFTLSGSNAFTGNNTHSGTETFTGTVTASKFNSTIYVDGTTYPLTAAGITSAIAAASAAGGGQVILPPGTITMNATSLAMPSNVLLVGAGWYQTTLRWNSSATDTIFLAAGTKFSGLIGMTLSYPTAASNAAIRIQTTDALPVQYNVFRDLVISWDGVSSNTSGFYITTQVTPAGTDFTLNTIDNVTIKYANNMVDCAGCEGNFWTKISGVNVGTTNGVSLMLFRAFNADEIIDARVEVGSLNATTSICLALQGSNNLVRLTCDGASGGQTLTAINDTGTYNILDVDGAIGAGTFTLGTVGTGSQVRFITSATGLSSTYGANYRAVTGAGSGIAPTFSQGVHALYGDMIAGGAGTCTHNSNCFAFGGMGTAKVTADTGSDRAVGLIGGATASASATTEIGVEAMALDTGGAIFEAALGSPLNFGTRTIREQILGDGGHHFIEQAAPAATVGHEVCYGDSTAHAMKCSNNNGTFSQMDLTSNTTTTTTQVLHGSATAGIGTFGAVVTADIATALTAPGPIGGTTPGTGAFTTLSSTGNFTPSQTNGIVGTTTNNNANAGSVGEYVQSVLATGSSVTLATGVTSNVTSISLTAGDWDVTGAVDFTFGATTSYTNLIGSVSTTTGTIGGQDSKFDFETPAAVPTAAADATFPLPVVRFSLASTTTVFLVAQGTFTVSTLKAYGTIRARRIR